MKNWFKSLFNKKETPLPYTSYKMYWHPKYEGTFMVFGFHPTESRMVLVDQSNSEAMAGIWMEKYGVDLPDKKNPLDNAKEVFDC